ncbi:hypothetical protein HanRHA438_Chr13g0584421 [Helianthus annuus]|nr:hypothetical protein HanRHA438_Chr13g0584421 [Helianthus annuus]
MFIALKNGNLQLYQTHNHKSVITKELYNHISCFRHSNYPTTLSVSITGTTPRIIPETFFRQPRNCRSSSEQKKLTGITKDIAGEFEKTTGNPQSLFRSGYRFRSFGILSLIFPRALFSRNPYTQPL